MGITELGNALGINKSVVSRLVAKGMPTTSVQSAQAWREVYAKPRAKRGMAGIAPPAPVPPKTYKVDSPKVASPEPSQSIDMDDEESMIDEEEDHHDSPTSSDDNDPKESRRRARLAEGKAFRILKSMQLSGGSMEDMQKANRIYFAARLNRTKAEQDFKQHQRDEGILLFFDEAKDLAGRPHIAAKQMLETMAKTLAPRCHGQPQKAIEATLAAWADTLAEVIRKAI